MMLHQKVEESCFLLDEGVSSALEGKAHLLVVNKFRCERTSQFLLIYHIASAALWQTPLNLEFLSLTIE